MADGGGEGYTVVSSECPGLPAGSRYTSDNTPCQGQNYEHGHCDCCCYTARCVVEDRQKRPAIGGVGYLRHVSPCEDQRDDHQETEESIDVRRVHDGPRN
jgi:hypothetical protein